MKQKLMNNIMQGMLGTLNNAQMKRLQLVLEAEFERYFECDDTLDISQMKDAKKFGKKLVLKYCMIPCFILLEMVLLAQK